jgi:hypothetical protein
MAIFLNWRTTDIGSRDRITTDLFSYLSSRWYPINIIRSSLYNVLDTYALELSSASVEISQVYDDLFIKSVRTSPVGTNSTSKIYDNFGALLGVGKLYQQDYERYSNVYSLQSYRQQLRILGEAFFSGMSVDGINKVGQAYTGVAPVVIQPLRYYDGWTLSTYTGSVVSIGNGLIGIDQDIPRIGHYIPTGSVSRFVIGDKYGVSNSVLGVNTVVRDIQHYYAGVVVYIYAASASISNSSFRDSIEYSVERILKASQKPLYFYSDQFAIYRPSTGSIADSVVNGIFSLSSEGYLYNSSSTSLSGSVFEGTPIILNQYGALQGTTSWNGLFSWDSNAWDLYYDWLVLTRNDAQYTMSVRTYPLYTIPSTVYYQDFNSNPISRLFHSADTSTVAHWIFEDKSKFWSIGKSPVNLTVFGSGNILPAFGRSEDWVGSEITSIPFVAYATGSSYLKFSSSFYFEMWVKGVDTSNVVNYVSGSIRSLFLKRQQNAETLPSGSFSLNGDGYLFGLNFESQMLNMMYTAGATVQTFSASISSYMSEIPSRYHYFAGTYLSGSVYMYIDDKIAYYNPSAGTMNALSTSGNIYMVASGSFPSSSSVRGTGSITIDEFVASSGFLSPEAAKNHFLTTKPRLTRSGVRKETIDVYQQPRVTVYASGSNEFEFHQFSTRWAKAGQTAFFDRKLADIYRLPLYKVSGSIV